MPSVIFDTSPLQYLFQLGRLDLVPQLMGSITVPSAVVSELTAGRRLGLPLPDVTNLGWVTVESIPNPSVLFLAWDLGAGEREVLALALHRPTTLIVVDDKLARRAAEHLSIDHTGTLGVLLRAKARSFVPALRPIMDDLITLGFRIDSRTYHAVLSLAGELD